MKKLQQKGYFILGILFVLLLIMPSGMMAGSFEDKRIYGENRYETAVQISKEGWKDGADTVVMARGDLFPDALSGAPLAYQLNAPILLTKPGKLPVSIKEEIERLQAEKVIILGGESAISANVEQSITSLGMKVERMAGLTRYETSLMIAQKLSKQSDRAIVATGMNFPDALAIAPYASENGYPILLTKPNQLSEDIQSYVNSFEETMVVGGIAAVSTQVENLLPNPTRISGANRYETAAEIIRYNYKKNEQIYISTGVEFADALTGSILAAKNHTSLLIVDEDRLPEGTDRVIANNQIRRFSVLGGEQAVTDNVIEDIDSLIGEFTDSVGSLTTEKDIRVLDSEEIELFEQAADKTEIVDGDTIAITLPETAATSLNSYKPGSLLYIPPSGNYPMGFLGQISKVESNGKLFIDQPNIDEVFKEFNIHEDESLTPNELVDFRLADGVTLNVNGAAASSISDISESNSGVSLLNAAEEPIELMIDHTLVSKGDAKSVKIQGGVKVTATDVDVDLKKNFIGMIEEFDYRFSSNQETSIKFLMNYEGKLFEELDQSKNIDFGDWLKLEGVDRAGRLSLATMTYQIGTTPIFGIGDKGYKEVPIGVTVFVTLNSSGEVQAELEVGIIEHSTLDAGAVWTEDGFDPIFNPEVDRKEVYLKGEGYLSSSLGVGFEPALNIMGLLPAVIQNDLTADIEIEGNVDANYDLKDQKSLVSGCVKLDFGVGVSSNLKVRLKAIIEKLNYEDKIEYNKTLWEKTFFNEPEIDWCQITGEVKGNITDSLTDEPLRDVEIEVFENGVFYKSASTDVAGNFTFKLSGGTYDILFKKSGFVTHKIEGIETMEDVEELEDFKMNRLPKAEELAWNYEPHPDMHIYDGTISDGIVYATLTEGIYPNAEDYLMAVDAELGEELWRIKSSIWEMVEIDDKYLYLSNSDTDEIVGYDKRTGNIEFKFDIWGRVDQIFVKGEKIYVPQSSPDYGVNQFKLSVYNTETGELVTKEIIYPEEYLTDFWEDGYGTDIRAVNSEEITVMLYSYFEGYNTIIKPFTFNFETGELEVLTKPIIDIVNGEQTWLPEGQVFLGEGNNNTSFAIDTQDDQVKILGYNESHIKMWERVLWEQKLPHEFFSGFAKDDIVYFYDYEDLFMIDSAGEMSQYSDLGRIRSVDVSAPYTMVVSDRGISMYTPL
ncbi:cell wall-binding repeat-containing protein [Bacillus salacetis]|uniref:cell wall-binding repeat-containing protein n=1 Tax=Bacillus salacetis TaxID=2315464 RepID=UPI003BA2D200